MLLYGNHQHIRTHKAERSIQVHRYHVYLPWTESFRVSYLLEPIHAGSWCSTAAHFPWNFFDRIFEWMSRYLAKSVFLSHFLAMNAPNHLKELKFLLKNILCGKLTNTYLSLTEIGHCLQQMNISSLQLHWNTSTFARIPHKKSVTWNCIY